RRFIVQSSRSSFIVDLIPSKTTRVVEREQTGSCRLILWDRGCCDFGLRLCDSMSSSPGEKNLKEDSAQKPFRACNTPSISSPTAQLKALAFLVLAFFDS